MLRCAESERKTVYRFNCGNGWGTVLWINSFTERLSQYTFFYVHSNWERECQTEREREGILITRFSTNRMNQRCCLFSRLVVSWKNVMLRHKFQTTHIETRHENNNHKYITCLSELKRLIHIEQHHCDQFSVIEGITQQANDMYRRRQKVKKKRGKSTKFAYRMKFI